jgi:hypothetical protein
MTLHDAIIRILHKRQRALSTCTLSVALKNTTTATEAALDLLVEQGRVRKNGRGKWDLTDEERRLHHVHGVEEVSVENRIVEWLSAGTYLPVDLATALSLPIETVRNVLRRMSRENRVVCCRDGTFKLVQTSSPPVGDEMAATTAEEPSNDSEKPTAESPIPEAIERFNEMAGADCSEDLSAESSGTELESADPTNSSELSTAVQNVNSDPKCKHPSETSADNGSIWGDARVVPLDEDTCTQCGCGACVCAVGADESVPEESTGRCPQCKCVTCICAAGPPRLPSADDTCGTCAGWDHEHECCSHDDTAELTENSPACSDWVPAPDEGDLHFGQEPPYVNDITTESDDRQTAKADHIGITFDAIIDDHLEKQRKLATQRDSILEAGGVELEAIRHRLQQKRAELSELEVCERRLVQRLEQVRGEAAE